MHVVRFFKGKRNCNQMSKSCPHCVRLYTMHDMGDNSFLLMIVHDI